MEASGENAGAVMLVSWGGEEGKSNTDVVSACCCLFWGLGMRDGETVGCREGCNGRADGGLGAPFRAPFSEACKYHVDMCAVTSCMSVWSFPDLSTAEGKSKILSPLY